MRSMVLRLAILSCLAWGPAARGAVMLERGPYLQSNDSQSVIVVWEMDTAAAAVVEYGINERFDQAQASPVGTQHAVRIEGLQPGTRYDYRIMIHGLQAAGGPSYTFTTAPEQGDVSFLVFGDSGRDNYWQWRMVPPILLEEVDLILHTGDVVYSRGQQYNYDRRFFLPYSYFMRHTPFFPSMGCHDLDTENGQPYIDNFHLPVGYLGDERVYSFDWGDIHFVSIETETLTPAAAAWVDADLAATDKPWKIVYSHHTAYSCGGRPSLDFWNLLVPVFEARDVDVHFGGHDHNYQRSYPVYQDAPIDQGQDPHYTDPQGVVYMVTGAISDLDSVDDDCAHTAVGGAWLHYTRTDLVGNTLTVSARDSMGTTLDSFSITKTPVASDASPTWVRSELLVWPNPTQGAATLELGARAHDLLDAGRDLEVRIFGVDGRLVRRLQARTPRLQWDGRDRHGRPAPNGVYLVRTYSHDTPVTQGTKVIRSR